MLSIHQRLGLPSGLFPSGFPTNKRYTFLFYPHSCHMSRSPHPRPLYNSNYTWRRVQIMKLLVMQLSPPSRHSIPLWSKYSPQYPVKIALYKSSLLQSRISVPDVVHDDANSCLLALVTPAHRFACQCRDLAYL
jgi:hypothetical protein